MRGFEQKVYLSGGRDEALSAGEDWCGIDCRDESDVCGEEVGIFLILPSSGMVAGSLAVATAWLSCVNTLEDL